MNIFKPTKQQLRKAWSFYNYAIFNGALKKVPSFRFNKKKNIFGQCFGSCISFSTVNNVDAQDYAETLAHEMVHQWQFENLPYKAFMSENDGHGECFKIWKNYVCKVIPSEDFD